MNENLLRRVGQCGIAFEAAKLVQHCVNSSTFHFAGFTFRKGNRNVRRVPKLIVFQAKTRQDLIERIVRFQQDNEMPLQEREGDFCLCCIDTKDELNKALRFLRNSNKSTYQSVKGSYFTSQPSRSENICLVYGDVGSHYNGAGKSLVKEFPYLKDVVKQRTLKSIDTSDPSLHEPSTTIELFRSVIYNSMLLTELSRTQLGIVAPQAAVGLSLGEIGMLFSLNTKNTNLSSEIMKRLEQSDLWKKRLTNEKTVVTWKVFRA